jgi:hypothetical protein
MASFKNLISNTSAQISSGGTITGDLVINGDLQVDGGGSLSFDEIIEGTSQIKVDNDVAFLVEKDDGTDVFVVDTNNQKIGINTSSPDFTLHVHGASDGAGYVKISDANTGEGATDGARIGFNSGVMRIQNFENSDMEFYVNNSTKPLVLESDGNATFAGNLALSASSPQINFSGSAGDYGTFGYTEGDPDVFKWALFQNSGQLASITIDAVSEASPSARFRFNVGGDTDSAIVIDSSKRVGIGLDNPSKPLHIYSSDNAPLRVQSTDAYSGIEFRDNTSSSLPPLISALADDFIIYGGNASLRPTILTLTSSTQSATFAGDVTSDGNLKLRSGSGRNIYFTEADGTVDEMSIGYDQANQRLRFRSNAHSADRMLITKSGSVGIGGSPDTLLHLQGNNGNASHTLLKIHNNDEPSNTETGQTADIEFNFQGTTNGGSSFVTKNAGAIRAGKDSDYFTSSADNMDSHLKFYTAQDNVNTLALTIDSSQRVGIGTASPSSYNALANNLVVYENSNSGITIGSSTSGTGSIFFADGTTGDEAYKGRIEYNHGQNKLQFGANSVIHTTLDASGNFGIGSSSPDKTLVVQASGAEVVISDTGTIPTLRFREGGATKGVVRTSGGTMQLYSGGSSASNIKLVLDDNSRISLSNNDSGSNNTVFGYKAGNAIASGTEGNVLIGHNTGLVLNGGDANVAIGADALKDGTTGTNNTLIGTSAGANIDSANRNTAVGYQALFSEDSDGDRTLAVGYQALYSQNGDTEAMGNSGLGYNTGFYNITGTLNTWVGYQAGVGASGQSNSENTGVGYRAGYSITTGNKNTIIGTSAGDAITTTSGCTLVGFQSGTNINHNDAEGTVALGYKSLELLTNGRYNTSVGYTSLASNANGDKNTAVGFQSLGDVNGASVGDNTAIGFNAGHTGTNDLTSGTANTLIGSSTAVSSATGVNQTVIGYNATGLADNSVTLGNSSVTDVYMAQDSGATVHCANINLGGVSSGGANTLDDYEEGTWTPAFVSASGHAPTISATYQRSYTKIGNVVTVSLYIAFGNDGGGTDQVMIDGLPFSISANTYYIVPANFRRTNFTSNIDQYGLMLESDDTIAFYYTSSTGDRVGLTYDDIDVSSNNVMFSFTYIDN